MRKMWGEVRAHVSPVGQTGCISPGDQQGELAVLSSQPVERMHWSQWLSSHYALHNPGGWGGVLLIQESYVNETPWGCIQPA